MVSVRGSIFSVVRERRGAPVTIRPPAFAYRGPPLPGSGLVIRSALHGAAWLPALLVPAAGAAGGRPLFPWLLLLALSADLLSLNFPNLHISM